MPVPIADLTGRQYGAWTVLARAHRDGHRKWHWMCLCACGVLAVVRGANLTSGHSTCCTGCRTYYTQVRGSILVRWGARTMTFKEWSEAVGHPMQRMYHRLRNDWTLTECLTVGTDPLLLELLGVDDTCEAEQVPYPGQEEEEET